MCLVCALTGEAEVSEDGSEVVDDIVKGIPVSRNTGGESAAKSQGAAMYPYII